MERRTTTVERGTMNGDIHIIVFPSVQISDASCQKRFTGEPFLTDFTYFGHFFGLEMGGPLLASMYREV